MKRTVQVGQVYDEIFGKYTWEVLFVTKRNALMVDTLTRTDEMLVSVVSLMTVGGGWRLNK